MTELSFLLDLLLNETLSKAVKVKLTERIRLVEAGQVPRGTMPPAHMVLPVVSGIPTHLAQQSPSTLANLSKDEVPVMQAPPPARARVVGGEVQTGNGTRGPRKF